MYTTAVEHLNIAHDSTFVIAQRAAAVLAAHEGLGAALTRAEIARAIGIELNDASSLDVFLVYLALDAAISHRGWSEVQEPGELKRYRKLPATRHYRKPAMSPVVKEKRHVRG